MVKAAALLLNLNDTDVVALSPQAGDVFVRAVAQGHLTVAENTTTLDEWGSEA